MDTLTARRLQWIDALESGKFAQGEGALFRQDVTKWDSDDLFEAVEVDSDSERFCCIGVARRMISPTWMRGALRQSSDGYTDYNDVRTTVEFDLRFQAHLVAMNDGGECSDTRRSCETKRDFRFIARFLRKVWGLTPLEVG